MNVAVFIRWFALILAAALAAALGVLLGRAIIGWSPPLTGSIFILIIGFLLSLLATGAAVVALPTTIRFARCGMKHFGAFVRDAWPTLLLLLLAATALKIGLASAPPKVDEECPPVAGAVATADPNIVRDRKEVATDLVFDYNKPDKRNETYSAEHVAKMDSFLIDLFADYDEIEVTAIIAHTDPIGSEQGNVALAQKRADFVRRAIERVASSKQLASRFNTPTIQPSIMVAEGPSGGDHRFWKACFDRFYVHEPANRPLEDLDADLAGKRPLCSVSTSDDGKDGIFPACRRIVPGDVGRSDVRGLARRLENFRELTACLAPMRHVVVSFNRARLPPETKCPKTVPAEAPADGGAKR
jgi:hypothetical protein